MARIYISSTFEDLQEYRAAAYKALRRLGHDVVAMEDYVACDERPLDRCLADVERCDFYIGIFAWRYGFVPPDGNPDRRSITELEYRKAEALRKPRFVFLVPETAPWPRKFVDTGEAEASLGALRRDLTLRRLGSFFQSDHELAELVSAAITRYEKGEDPEASRAVVAQVTLVPKSPYVEPPFPDTPYPLLQPYDHPATFGGRDREIEELERRVRMPQLVLCVHAPSGAGKSSLLRAGLLPRLRRQGYPVSLDWHPDESGVVAKIAAEWFNVPGGFDPKDDDLDGFLRLVAEARRGADDKPPIILLDQLDDALRRRDGGEDALARLGPLMAATARRLDHSRGYACRWVLCYRHEFHGTVAKWLEDVLHQARANGRKGLELVPYDLSGHDRVHGWVLPVMGTPQPGAVDGQEVAVTAFLQAIQKPLEQSRSEGARKESVRFEAEGARRLAEAFARARARDREQPLVPELQVVLSHLQSQARVSADGVRLVRVPANEEDLDREIDSALIAHVGRALDEAFPFEVDQDAPSQAKARVLIALRELADAQGLRGASVSRARLEAAIGTDARRILDKLASPAVRLVVVTHKASGVECGLSHDRLAHVITTIVDDPSVRADLQLDNRLVDLRRFVEQRTDLYLRSHDETALTVTEEQHALIQAAASALVWDDRQRKWWTECDGWFRTSRRFEESPQAGFAALLDLVRQPRDDLRGLHQRLRAASVPPDVFWFGPWRGGATSAEPVAIGEVLNVLERTWPAFVSGRQKRWESYRAVAYAIEEAIWYADQESGSDEVRQRGIALRHAVRDAWASHNRGANEPPRFRSDALFLPDEPLLGFVEIPERDRAVIGSDRQRDPQAYQDEHWPPDGQGTIELSTLYVARYPVTVAQFKTYVRDASPSLGFDEGLRRGPEHPMVYVSWHEALAYCRWLDAQLRDASFTPPTLRQCLGTGWQIGLSSEVEWEKGARGSDGRIFAWGSDIDADRCNYARAGVGGTSLVGAFPRGASPYGLHDMCGNVWEWTRSLWGEDRDLTRFKYPYRPMDGREDLDASNKVRRVVRGGSFFNFERLVRAAVRYSNDPDFRGNNVGFRVVVSRS